MAVGQGVQMSPVKPQVAIGLLIKTGTGPPREGVQLLLEGASYESCEIR